MLDTQVMKRNRSWSACAMLMTVVVLLSWFPSEGSAQRNEGGTGVRKAPKSAVPATPGTAGPANVTLPKFPKKFEVQGPESDSFGFAVTQPGSIAVEVQAQGAPVVVTLQSFGGGQPITQRGPGLLRLFYNATAQDVQRSVFWQVQVRTWCEDDCLTAGKRPRAAGVVRVQHPPVDQAAVQKAMRAMVAQQKQPSPKRSSRLGPKRRHRWNRPFSNGRRNLNSTNDNVAPRCMRKFDPKWINCEAG